MTAKPCRHPKVTRLETYRGRPGERYVTYSWKCRECDTPFQPVEPGSRFDPLVNPFAN